MGSFFKKIFGDDEARVSAAITGTPPPPPGSSQGGGENKDSWKVQLQYISELVGQVEENTRDGFKTMVYPMQRTDMVDAFVRISIVNVGDIDTVKQEFDCEFYLSIRWAEPRLEYDMETKAVIEKGPRWGPSIFFANLLQHDLYEMNQVVKFPEMAYNSPEIMLYFHIRGKFKQVFDVRSFPFDYQTLNIKMTARCSIDTVTFSKDPVRDDTIRTANFASKNEWDLQQHVLTEDSTTMVEEGSTDNVFSVYNINLHAMRYSAHYLYNIALIMNLITALTFTSYTVDASSPADRLSITLTLLLTSVALKYVVNGYVPQVAYLTLLDKFIISCMVFQFFVSVESAIAALIHKHFKSALGLFELASFGVLAFIFVCIQLVFGIWSLKCWLKARKMKTKHAVSYKKNRDNTTNLKKVRIVASQRNKHYEASQDRVEMPQMYSMKDIV
eukprot:Seg4379.1 transcript_id=Seg4379.1/GoldUCD/mRNA.D3Y31 product="Cys-loop ligand-gated ion channel" protein_id=Seg4379.1/GoldUCD/D3Y31